MASGVRAGANRPNQASVCKPFTTVSSTVGTSVGMNDQHMSHGRGEADRGEILRRIERRRRDESPVGGVRGVADRQRVAVGCRLGAEPLDATQTSDEGSFPEQRPDHKR